MKNNIRNSTFFTFLFSISICLGAVAQTTINSVDASESRCSSTGSLIIHATGGTAPYMFAIISGPETRPDQSDSLFNSLPPGTYIVRARDVLLSTDTSTVTVSGTYSTPTFTPTFTNPNCPGSSTGSIKGNGSSGRLAYTWALVSPSTVLAAPQPSDIFTGLPAGSYTVQMTDSCSNIQLRTVILTDPAVATGYLYPELYRFGNTKQACDSFDTYAYISGGAVNYPITVRATTPYLDTVFRTITAPGQYLMRVKGYTTPMTLFITDACGNTSFSGLITPDSAIVERKLLSGCPEGYTFWKAGGGANLPFLSPITYELLDAGAVVLATQVDNPAFFGYPIGNYTLRLTDACGTTTHRDFTWLPPAVPTILLRQYAYACMDSGAIIRLGLTNWAAPVSVSILSGPATYGSTKAKLAHSGTYAYPNTFSTMATDVIMSNFVLGTYKIKLTDACGYSDSLNVVVSDVQNKNYTYTYTKGCPNANKINFTTNGELSGLNSKTFSIRNIGTGVVVASNSIFGDAVAENRTIVNLAAGTYVLTMSYSVQAIPINGFCSSFTDTLVIPPYTTPSIKAVVMSRCAGDIHTAALPDTSNGSAPYRYEIISGPAGYTAVMQSSPEFQVPTVGTYTYRITDTCGNTNTYSIGLDTLSVPNVTTVGSGCLGSNTRFYAVPNSYYTYKWTKPDGSTFTGDTLIINPVTTTDFGTYQIELFSNVSGCLDTAARSGTFTDCSILPVQLINFVASNDKCLTTIKWHSGLEQNLERFELEKSTDGRLYTSIVSLNSKGSNSQYEFEIRQETTTFYRLKITEKNGHKSYSQTLVIVTDCNQPNEWSIVPNPANKQVKIIGLTDITNLKISNVLGQTIWSGILKPDANTINIEFLQNGMYLIHAIELNGNTHNIKLIKN